MAAFQALTVYVLSCLFSGVDTKESVRDGIFRGSERNNTQDARPQDKGCRHRQETRKQETCQEKAQSLNPTAGRSRHVLGNKETLTVDNHYL